MLIVVTFGGRSGRDDATLADHRPLANVHAGDDDAVGADASAGGRCARARGGSRPARRTHSLVARIHALVPRDAVLVQADELADRDLGGNRGACQRPPFSTPDRHVIGDPKARGWTSTGCSRWARGRVRLPAAHSPGRSLALSARRRRGQADTACWRTSQEPGAARGSTGTLEQRRRRRSAASPSQGLEQEVSRSTGRRRCPPHHLPDLAPVAAGARRSAEISPARRGRCY